MLTRRMFPLLIGAFVASALLAILSGAPSALARFDSGAVADRSVVPLQEEPSCEDRCERHADEVFLECRARGASIEDCADEARRALAECLEDCDRPEEPTCLERCEAHGHAVQTACLEAGRGPDVCEHEGREAYEACVAENCEREEPPAEPGPGCADRCEERAREVKTACLERGGGMEECAHEAREAFEECVEGCDKPEDPPKEPSCEQRCEDQAKEVRDACLEGGGGPDACEREMHEAYEACVLENCRREEPPKEPSCEQRCEDHAKKVRDACLEGGGGPDVCDREMHAAYEACVLENCRREEPPKEPGCADRCEARAREVKIACIERGGSAEVCAREAHEAFEECIATCDKPADPGEPPCSGHCERHATEVRNACIARGGGPDLCDSEGRKAYEDCLAKCKPWELPEEPGCKDRCEAHAREVKHACLEGGGGEEECIRKFEAAFKACVAEKCKRPEPRPPVDPPSCEKKCQARWEDVFHRCREAGRGEEECRAAANTERDACISACERPPVPEPPRCEERCARYRAAVLKACMETGAGEEFCVSEADQARERCIVQCTRPTVISPGRSCASICAQLGRLAYSRCISGGGGPEECRAKAQSTIEQCSERCERPDPGGRGVIPIGR